jgi:hypothetical protein
LIDIFIQIIIKIIKMGFFDKLKNKAEQALSNIPGNNNQDEELNKQSVEMEEDLDDEDKDIEEEDDEDEGPDFDVTKMPKGWENLSDDDVLGKIGVVGLEYYNRNDDLNYLIEEGFVSERHLGAFKEYFENMLAEKRGISLLALAGQAGIAQQNYMLKLAGNMTGAGGLLEPVEGITCEDWAMVNAKIASGGAVEESIKLIGVDLAKWDRVNKEWETRMSNDISGTLSNVYAKAFTTSASGNLGGKDQINEQNFPYEKYVEIFVAQEKLNAQGKDAQSILASFGLSVVDWSTASAFWFQKFHENTEKYFYEEQRLRKIFEEKYKAGSIHGDIEF